MQRLRQIALPVVLLAAAIGAGAVLLRTPPQVPKALPAAAAAVVGVAELHPQSPRVFVEAFGTVTAAREVRVQPEVSGRVVFVHARLVPGGVIGAGEALFRIDRQDYEIGVQRATADVAVADLQVERLRAGVDTLANQIKQIEAEIEYLRWNADRLGRLSEGDQASEAEARDASSRLASQRAALAALRARVVEQEKSVASAQAEVRVARTRLASAELALTRTEVTAPFDGIVLTESVEIGQLVGPQNAVATLAATDEFWVEATVPLASLPDIRFAEDDGGPASPVTVTVVTGGAPVVREGVVLRRLGALDPQGRMARILISIHDPLQLHAEKPAKASAILVGSYVRVAIDAGVLDNVIPIPRLALRENSRVWVRDGSGRLDIRDLTIVWRRQDDVLVRDGFAPDDRLIVTHLASVIPGMPLEVRERQDGETAAAPDRSAMGEP